VFHDLQRKIRAQFSRVGLVIGNNWTNCVCKVVKKNWIRVLSYLEGGISYCWFSCQ